MYYINEIKNRQKYINVIILSFVAVFFVFIFGIYIKLGSTIGPIRSDVYEGQILSSDGVVLTEHLNTESEDMVVSHAASLTYPAEYSALLGYNSSLYGMSGLRDIYFDYLYQGKNGEIGNTLNLTINHKLQEGCYKLLDSYGKNGSIVVMNTKTGAVEALVSYKEYSEYNANAIDDEYDNWAEVDEFFYPEWSIARCPGSTFKIVSALGILESGKAKKVYDDTTGYIEVGDKKINNANGAVFGKLNLKEALKYSANVYFVKMYNGETGIEYLNNAASSFLIGQEILTDFGAFYSNWDVDEEDKNEISQTVFGQGKTEVTTVHQAMIISSVVNGGKVLRPYVVTNILNEEGTEEKNNSLFKKDKTEVIAKSMDKSASKNMKKMMEYTAKYYGMGEGYYAKSGTAEISDYGDVQSWLVAANENHAVVISIENAGYGMNFAKYAKAIIDLAESVTKVEE